MLTLLSLFSLYLFLLFSLISHVSDDGGRQGPAAAGALERSCHGDSAKGLLTLCATLLHTPHSGAGRPPHAARRRRCSSSHRSHRNPATPPLLHTQLPPPDFAYCPAGAVGRALWLLCPHTPAAVARPRSASPMCRCGRSTLALLPSSLTCDMRERREIGELTCGPKGIFYILEDFSLLFNRRLLF